MNYVDNYIPSRVNAGGDAVATVRRGLDPLLFRPFLDEKDRACLIVNTGEYTVEKGERLPVRRRQLLDDLLNARRVRNMDIYNAVTLRKEDWVAMDTALIRAVRQPLNAWEDLVRLNSLSGFDAYSRSTMEWEAMSDPGEAVIDMDARADGRNDQPLFDLRSLPLPITHTDFSFGDRYMAIMGNSMPIDTTMIEAAGRRIGESVERITIGTSAGIEHGTRASGYLAHTLLSKVYGYTNYTHRITKTDLNTPTGSNPEAVFQDVLESVALLRAQGFYGPYIVYLSTNYFIYANNDYFRSGSTATSTTLLRRILDIPQIRDVREMTYLTSGYQMIVLDVSDTSLMPRAVVGMQPTVLRWPGKGGLEENFKVMAILVPQFRSDYSGKCPYVHATTS